MLVVTAEVRQLLDVPMLQLATTMLLHHATTDHVSLLHALDVLTQRLVTTTQQQPSITDLVYNSMRVATAVVLLPLDVPMLQLVTMMQLHHATTDHVSSLLALDVQTQQLVTTTQLQPSITVLVYN
jgi:hypothetical protein